MGIYKKGHIQKNPKKDSQSHAESSLNFSAKNPPSPQTHTIFLEYWKSNQSSVFNTLCIWKHMNMCIFLYAHKVRNPFPLIPCSFCEMLLLFCLLSQSSVLIIFMCHFKYQNNKNTQRSMESDKKSYEAQMEKGAVASHAHLLKSNYQETSHQQTIPSNVSTSISTSMTPVSDAGNCQVLQA